MKILIMELMIISSPFVHFPPFVPQRNNMHKEAKFVFVGIFFSTYSLTTILNPQEMVLLEFSPLMPRVIRKSRDHMSLSGFEPRSVSRVALGTGTF